RDLRPARRERRLILAQRLEQGLDPVELGLREFRPGAADVDELAVALLPHEQGADALGAGPLPRHPAADHDLLATDVLDLDPRVAAPAGQVERVDPLCHNAFKPLLTGRGEDVGAAADDMFGRLPALAVEVQA